MNDHTERTEPGHGAERPAGDEQHPGDERQHVWDKPSNVKLLFNGFYALCAIVVVLELVIPPEDHHAWERLPAFYPIYGFVGIVVLVLIAKQMRRALMRPEDHYDE